jgi:hypothetical protein
MRALPLLLLLGCQLGDDPDPPRCDAGSHPELDRCVADETAKEAVKIAAACVITPETLVVKSNQFFQFDNQDTAAHEIKGSDGKVWANVRPNERSLFTQIERVGTWAYTVSGCPKGGSVKVE